jgi:POT family proton-dependent oligopeptide transporter
MASAPHVTETAPGAPIPQHVGLRYHPRGFWFIFWGEFAERCAFYGMLAILARYMAEQLELGQANANTYVQIFMGACYFLPLLGGYLADNFFGKYNIIVAFCIPYILGPVILTIESPWFMAGGLVLLAMGSGVIKPNISTLMGLTYDQQRPGQELLRSNAFAIFYMAINIGAAVSIFSVPAIRTAYGYSWAFLFPAVLMALAFGIFAAGKRFYAKEVIARRRVTPEERALQGLAIKRVAGLFLLIVFFWAIFNQASTTWIFFANTYMDRTLFGHEFDPEQFGTLNPVFIVLLVPVVTFFWNFLAGRGIKVRATDKMLVGFLLTALCMAVMSVAGFRTGTGEMRPVVKDGHVEMKDGKPVEQLYVPEEQRVTIWWQVLAFLLITVAEILISVVGLELAFVVSPPSMKGFITGLWLLTVSLASLFINAPVGRLYTVMSPGAYFAMLSGALVIVAFAFIFVARRFNRAPPVVEEPTEIPAA